ALSVLTEPDFFEGADESVAAARRGAGRLPLLRKDFLVDPWQIWESRRLGADAVLLIATVLPDQQLATLLSTAVEADLDALVEVKNEAELARAVAAGARIIGVNARDLSDFSVDLSRAERLVRRMPAGVVRVGESGVSGPGDLRRLAQAGFDAALVGTSLMVTARPGRTLRGWLAAGAREQRR
ncbi:MAG: indole-3-glycerol-phosphate synthase, partial [Acidobacteriota bacterium]